MITLSLTEDQAAATLVAAMINRDYLTDVRDDGGFANADPEDGDEESLAALHAAIAVLEPLVPTSHPFMVTYLRTVAAVQFLRKQVV